MFDTDRQHLLTSMWSDHLIGRPENQMTGVTFSRGGYHRIGKVVANGVGGYTVYRPEHWVFDGTEVVYGDLIGAGSVVVGYECDGCDFTVRDGLPHPTGERRHPGRLRDPGPDAGRARSDGTTRRGACPTAPDPRASSSRWRVLGVGGPRRRWPASTHGHAVMGVHQPGGTVFTAGSTEWAWGLANHDPVIERITANLLDRLTS